MDLKVIFNMDLTVNWTTFYSFNFKTIRKSSCQNHEEKYAQKFLNDKTV